MSISRERRLSCRARRREIGSLTLAGIVTALMATSTSAWAQIIVVTPDDQTVFMFAGPEGGPLQPQTITSWELENSDAQDAQFVVTVSQPWLKVTPAGGTLSGILNDKVDVVAELDAEEALGLAAGVYTASVSFQNLTNSAGDTQRTVRLEVAPANFSVTPAFVNVTTSTGSANPADKVVSLINSGQLDLNYELSWTTQSWFSVSKDSGTVPGNGDDTFAISFNIAGLAAGTYTSEIEITNTTNGAGSRVLPLALIVKPGGVSSVTLRPDADMEVVGPVGSLALLANQFVMVNEGDKAVRWNAIVSEPWISVSPSSGELAASDGAAGGLDERSIAIRFNAAVQTLPPGSAAATATFQTITTNPLTGEVFGVAFATRVAHVVANPVLTLSAPAVGGVVTTSPEGTVSLGSTATTRRLTFNFGEVIVVTAAPSDGYEFRGWAGNYPDDAQLVNPLILPMDESKSLGALIAPILRTLTLSTTGGGTGTIDMDPTGAEIENALEARYTNGTSVELFAEADAGSVFRGWSGNVPQGMELENPLTVLMDRERVISARFEPTLELVVNVQSGGSVTIEPDLPAYSAGMAVTLTALADEDFHFTGWSGGATGTSPSITITLTGDTVVTAAFAAGEPGDPGDPGDPNVAKLTVDIQGNGLVTPNGGNYTKGATVTVIATPTVNSRFVRWEQDVSGTELTATVVMDANKTVRAIFEATPGGNDDPSPRPSPSGGASTCGAAGMIGFAGMFVGWMSLALVSRKRFQA